MTVKPMVAFALSLGLILPVADTSALQINEIRIDQPGADNDEYVELFGDANQSLDGISYIVIGDGAAGNGTLDAAINLSGLSLNANGLLLLSENTLSLGAIDQVRTLNFENSDNVTHALISNTTLAAGDDLDSDDDGVLNTGIEAQIIDSIALVETPNSGEAFYGSVTVGPDGTFVPGHVFYCPQGWQLGAFDPINSSDTPGTSNPCQGGDTPDEPVVTERSIPQIQSSEPTSPFNGDRVITSGIVTADFQADEQLRGFYLQDENGDGDPNTSDGIFVFTGTVTPDTDVAVGDRVEVTADVVEFFGLTELTNVGSITRLGNGIIQPTPLHLPESVEGDLERVEGMLVEIVSPMTVSQTFFLGRFGQITLSSPDDEGHVGRLFQPTDLFAANSFEAIAARDSNNRRKLVLDDASRVQNPSPVPFINNTAVTSVRGGDQVSNLVGVIDFGRINTADSDYILQPTQAPLFSATNPRTTTPDDTGGNLKVASFNVLNFFNTIDTGQSVCGTGNQGCRGADSELELSQQTQKLVAAITAINADVVGLIEIENNGYGDSSAIATLTAAINAALGEGTYEFVAPPGVSNLGTDAIAVGFIYKPSTVEIVGEIATLDSGAFDQTLSNGRSRQPLAVSFRDLERDAAFTAVINHFRSKRPGSSPLGDLNDDQGDGQGSFNLRRTEAANDLVAWLASDPTGIEDPDVLILGDLNAYAEEDPLLAFDSQGYIDLIQAFGNNQGYSFTFDGQAGSLDHALATSDMAAQVSGVTQWHINTDESPLFDYNTEFNPSGFFSADAFRSSDHDPVIVGLALTPELLDADQDSVDDREADLCIDTPIGAPVNAQGCSGQQLVALNCEPLFLNSRKAFTRCVFRTVVSAKSQGLLSTNEARQIYWQAIVRVFFSKFFNQY